MLSARGLYHRSGISPCPEGLYLIDVIIVTQRERVNHVNGLYRPKPAPFTKLFQQLYGKVISHPREF
jgi:hypothetical protein